MSETTQFPVVPGSLIEPGTRRRFRANCTTEGTFVGPERSSFDDALGDARRHDDANPSHNVIIVSGD
jgi:hypothetical protein